MSQPLETHTGRTGYSTAAGIMIIIAACMLLLANILNLVLFDRFFWLILAGALSTSVLYCLAIAGGALILTRTHLLFSVATAAFIIPITASGMTSLTASLLFYGNVTTSIGSIVFIIPYPTAFVLAVLSLFLLAKSKAEFS